MSGRSRAASGGARARARRLAMQALYQRMITGDTARDLISQFSCDPQMDRADAAYFRELLIGIEATESALDELIDAHADRPVGQLDPVEHAILLIGAFELRDRQEIPYRVIVNEAIELGHTFGGEDAHKFVNAVLDRIAKRLRKAELARAPAGG